jgi:hypothetical protein
LIILNIALDKIKSIEILSLIRFVRRIAGFYKFPFVFKFNKANTMAEPKTRQTDASVDSFIERIDNEQKRDDCFTIIKMMEKATRSEPKMWGPSIIGFGKTNLVYATGRELDWPQLAFSPRKQALTLYLTPDLLKGNKLLDKLGKHKTSKGCLYIKSLQDIDLKVLQKLFDASLKTPYR